MKLAITGAQRPIYLFVHLPKTGGQSVRQQLAKKLGSRMLSLGHEKRTENPLVKAGQTMLNDVDLVAGHRVTFETANFFPNREPRFIVTLRDPAAYLHSLYNWQIHVARRGLAKTPPDDFMSWCKRQRNRQARWLLTIFYGMDQKKVAELNDLELLREANKVLDKFWLVARLEELKQTMRPLSQALGIHCRFDKWRNASGRDYPIIAKRTSDSDAEIRLYSAVDMALHAAWRVPKIERANRPERAPAS